MGEDTWETPKISDQFNMDILEFHCRGNIWLSTTWDNYLHNDLTR